MVNILEKGKGCLIKEPSITDYRLEVMPVKATVLPTSYSVEDKLSSQKDQGASSSCVGQGFAYYLEVLNKIETGNNVELSARDNYSKIFLSGGGAYLVDACKKIKNQGCVIEKDATSYENGAEPSEKFMRTRDDITSSEQDNGMTFLAKSYFTMSSTVANIKRAIYEGNGCCVACTGDNAGWQTADIQLPKSNDWGHCVFLTGYDDTTKKFKFKNSWGKEWRDNGSGYLPYEYVEKGFVSNAYVLVDASNSYYTSLLSIIENLKNKIKELLKI